MEAIDLTNSDGDEERPVKRQRRSSPLDEVQIVKVPATPDQAAADPHLDLRNEDFVITKATEPVWNEDLPHSRTQCGKHPFTASESINNREHCSKCFCYICDVEADKCTQWGSGSRSNDHCNAHGGRQVYKDIRACMRTCTRASPPVPNAALPPATQDAVESMLRSAAGTPAPQDAVQSVCRNTLENSAAQPSTPQNVVRRLSNSTCSSTASSSASAAAESSESSEPAQYVGPPPINAPLLRAATGCIGDSDKELLLSAVEAGRMLSAPREAACRHGLSVEMYYTSGGEPPKAKVPMLAVERQMVLPDPALDDKLVEIGTIRLPIQAKAPYTLEDLQQRLVPTGVGSNIDEGDGDLSRVTIHTLHYNELLRLLPLPQLPQTVDTKGRAKPITIGVRIHKNATLPELLAAVKQHPAGSCSPEEQLEIGYCATRDGRPSFAKAHMLSQSTNITEHQASMGYVAYRVPLESRPEDPKQPQWVVVDNKQRRPPGHYLEYQEVAYTVLLPMPPGEAWKGGKTAVEIVSSMVGAALAPYRKEGMAAMPLTEGFSLQRCHPCGQVSFLDKPRCFDGELPDTEALSYTANVNGNTMFLAAVWTPGGLELYDTDSWSEPEIDASASPVAMAGAFSTDETRRLVAEEADAVKQVKLWAKKPKTLVLELSQICRTYLPHQIQLAQRANVRIIPPAAACKLAIIPADEVAADLAILTIQVYVWKEKGYLNRDFWQVADEWPLHGKDHYQVMEYFSRGDPAAKAMRSELSACAEKMHTSISIEALMKLLEAEERPEASQPPGLMVELHPYQRQSLRFMIENEQGEGGHRRHFWVPYKTPSGFTIWWSPVFKRASRDIAPCPWGGFLAEEMGCGKTVEVLALILSNPAPPNIVSGTVTPDGYILSRATLVVCPVSVVGQWMEEVKSKLSGPVRIYQYHGPGRNKDPLDLATSYDLVVTTYQTLGSDWRIYKKKGANTNQGFQPLGQIKWHRVVLDESHTLKSGGTQQTQACCALKADRRWCCSGTPISTKVSELLGQFRFLGCQTFDTAHYFSSQINPAWSSGGYCWMSEGASNLLYALSRMLIRHTQQQSLGCATVCKLPEKTEELIAVDFSEKEQHLYMHVHKEAKAKFEQVALGGSKALARNSLAIMSLLGPLRAICSGGVLCDRDVRVLDIKDRGPNEVDSNLMGPSDECPICFNDMERPCRTPCLHWFCRVCITAELDFRKRCPMCRTQLQAAQLVEGVPAAREEKQLAVDAAAIPSASSATTCDSKLRVLLKQLADMRERDPTAKALVFTQFNSTLTWLMARLTEEGYSYRTISGNMTLKKRSQAIDAFQKDPPTTVFLLSMRSGAVGINLTAANHVFILEPAMNPALEDQAVGRAFRMGQTRPVTVKKLYIKGLVEECIMALVKDRREGRATGAAASVAGSIATDRQELKLAELQLLFQDPDFTRTAGVDRAAAT